MQGILHSFLFQVCFAMPLLSFEGKNARKPRTTQPCGVSIPASSFQSLQLQVARSLLLELGGDLTAFGPTMDRCMQEALQAYEAGGELSFAGKRCPGLEKCMNKLSLAGRLCDRVCHFRLPHSPKLATSWEFGFPRGAQHRQLGTHGLQPERGKTCSNKKPTSLAAG